jgi:hypothetical protein
MGISKRIFIIFIYWWKSKDTSKNVFRKPIGSGIQLGSENCAIAKL